MLVVGDLVDREVVLAVDQDRWMDLDILHRMDRGILDLDRVDHLMDHMVVILIDRECRCRILDMAVHHLRRHIIMAVL